LPLKLLCSNNHSNTVTPWNRWRNGRKMWHRAFHQLLHQLEECEDKCTSVLKILRFPFKLREPELLNLTGWVMFEKPIIEYFKSLKPRSCTWGNNWLLKHVWSIYFKVAFILFIEHLYKTKSLNKTYYG
jgi:hypothetical protein